MMKRFLLLLVMLLSAALLTGCVASVKPTETPCPTSGELEVELVNSFLSLTLDEMQQADDVSLTGSVAIVRQADNTVVATVPAKDVRLKSTMVDSASPQASNLTMLIPYQDLELNVAYTLDFSNLSVNLLKRGRVIKTQSILLLPDQQYTFTPTVLPPPVVPVTGDGASPALWLTLLSLTLVGAMLLRRRAA